MNYIAHIHLAHLSQTSLLGNFLGDFVKGSDLSHLKAEHHLGIYLHRKIDSYTDSHAVTKELRNLFPRSLRRMSGVMLDVYFDHLLCRHWHRYSEVDLDRVLALFYNEMAISSLKVSSKYLAVKNGLLKHQWLNDYKNDGACLRAFINIEKRLKFNVSFAQDGYQFIRKHDQELEQAFLSFYPQIIQYTKHSGAIFLRPAGDSFIVD